MITIAADATAGTLVDILRTTLGQIDGVTAGRMATVTLTDDDADKITRELDARGIPWGLG